jgi:hypothetical protein
MFTMRFTYWRLLGVALALVASEAHGAMVDAIVLTENGANMEFVLTGTYAPDTPVTAFSAPNLPYMLTFTLPRVPANVAFFVDGFGFGIDADVTVNGVQFPGSQVVFFHESMDGGLLLCLGQACNPDPNVVPYPAWNFWNTFGNQAYSGPESAPAFIAGDLNVDSDLSFYVITGEVPEPSSFLLAGSALAALAMRRRHGLRQ